MRAFMDHAETLGIRPIMAMIASHYASRYPGTVTIGELCTCATSPFLLHYQRRVLLSATHDLTCPVHRVIVVCGNAEDIKALVNKSHEFALECVRVVREPLPETVEDFEFAKTIVGVKP